MILSPAYPIVAGPVHQWPVLPETPRFALPRRMRFVGRREGLNDELIRRMDWAEEHTGKNERITLFVAFNYGGRAEIVDAARTFTGDSEEEFRRHLYAPDMPDPDVLVRTSGEFRISNYLLWELAYAELVFTDVLWPDFRREDLFAAIREFQGRSRRFGAVDEVEDDD